MDMDFAIYSLYSNLIDTKVKFCSLCFKIVKENAVCIQDSVVVGFDEDAEGSNSEEVDIEFILQEILGDKTVSYLSENDALCDKCTGAAISSYKFIKMCKTNTESMANAVDLLTTTVGDPDVEIGDKKSFFLSVNFYDSTCIQHFDQIKFKNNKSALTRFQSLFRSYILVTGNEGNTMYQCTKCPASYPKASSARRHFTSKHIEDPDIKKEVLNMSTVPVVASPAKVGRSYKKHDNDKSHTVIKDAEGKNKYKCKKCPTVFSKAASARQHYQLAHAQIEKSTEKRLKTREISKDFVKYLNQVSYVEITDIDGTNKYQCTECVTVCSNPWNARRHFETTHIKEDTFVLEVKQKTLSRRPATCIFCNESFDNKYVLTKHILQEHSIETTNDFTGIESNNKVFTHVYTVIKDDNECEKCRCKVCGKLYKNNTIVITHFKKHHLKASETDQQFICSHCAKECRDQYALKKHEEHHTLKLTCPTCNKVYKSRVFFKQHVCFKTTARSEMQKDVICDHCGKKFVSKDSLRIHIRYRHDPQSRRYPCQHCPKTFGALSHWKGHQIKHTKERNFRCDICGNVFVTKMALVYHTRIHTGERPFECKYCDMRFLSSSRRAHHIKRHHIAEMATCDICGVTLKAVGMAKHKRRHNNVNSTLYTINRIEEYAEKGQGSKKSANKTCQQLRSETDSE